MLVEGHAERASGDSQGRAQRSTGGDLQMGLKAPCILPLRYCDKNEHLPLVSRQRGAAGISDLQPAPRRICQCLQERIKGRKHLAGVLSAQLQKLARYQGATAASRYNPSPTPDQEVLPVAQPGYIRFVVGSVPRRHRHLLSASAATILYRLAELIAAGTQPHGSDAFPLNRQNA
jgi:hypothetical protein